MDVDVVVAVAARMWDGTKDVDRVINLSLLLVEEDGVVDVVVMGCHWTWSGI